MIRGKTVRDKLREWERMRQWLRRMERRVRSYTEDSYAVDEAKELAEQMQADISCAMRGEKLPRRS